MCIRYFLEQVSDFWPSILGPNNTLQRLRSRDFLNVEFAPPVVLTTVDRMRIEVKPIGRSSGWRPTSLPRHSVAAHGSALRRAWRSPTAGCAALCLRSRDYIATTTAGKGTRTVIDPGEIDAGQSQELGMTDIHRMAWHPSLIRRLGGSSPPGRTRSARFTATPGPVGPDVITPSTPVQAIRHPTGAALDPGLGLRPSARGVTSRSVGTTIGPACTDAVGGRGLASR